jgi:osmotically-inducible protein OsmY
MAQFAQPTDPYLAEHVREALTHDPRTVGLEFDVTQDAESVHVRGTVSTPQRRAAAQQVLDELFANHEVVNELTVQEFPEPTRVEHIA